MTQNKLVAGLKLNKSDIAAAGLRGVTTEQLLVRLPLFLSNSAFWLPEADDDDEADEDDEVAALAAAHGLVGPGPDKVRGDTGSRVETPNTLKRNASRAQSMSRGNSRATVGTSASKSASRSRLRTAQAAVTYTAKPRVLDERALKKSSSVKNVPLQPEVSPNPGAAESKATPPKASPRDVDGSKAEAEFKTPGSAHKRASSRSGRSHSRKDKDGHSHSRSRRSRSRRRDDGDSSSHAASRASRRSRSRSRRHRKHSDGHSHSRSHRGHRSKDGHDGSDGRSHRSHRSSRKHKHRHRDRDDASAANPAVSAVTDMQRVDSAG